MERLLVGKENGDIGDGEMDNGEELRYGPTILRISVLSFVSGCDTHTNTNQSESSLYG